MKEQVSESSLLAAARARVAQSALVASSDNATPLAVPDPLHLCVYTTVAVLAWLFTPALVAAGFGTVGFVGYLRAWRAGARKSSCILADPRLVMAYLGLVALAGFSWTIWRVVHLLATLH